MNRHGIAKFTIILATLTLALASRGSTILSFAPASASSSPEINFAPTTGETTPSFAAGPGAVGQGDGNLLSGSTSPGLTLSTPVSIASGIDGEQSNADGSTTFYDATLTLTGFAADSSAIEIPLTPTLLVQPLGSGTFTFSASTPGGGAGVTLLSGTIGNALISGAQGSGAGSEINGVDITYTGGVIYNTLVSESGTPAGGSESISLLSVTPPFSLDGSTGYLTDFTANATGQFSVTSAPEPNVGVGALLGLLAIYPVGRFRHQSTVRLGRSAEQVLAVQVRVDSQSKDSLPHCRQMTWRAATDSWH